MHPRLFDRCYCNCSCCLWVLSRKCFKMNLDEWFIYKWERKPPAVAAAARIPELWVCRLLFHTHGYKKIKKIKKYNLLITIWKLMAKKSKCEATDRRIDRQTDLEREKERDKEFFFMSSPNFVRHYATASWHPGSSGSVPSGTPRQQLIEPAGACSTHMTWNNDKKINELNKRIKIQTKCLQKGCKELGWSVLACSSYRWALINAGSESL